MTAIKEKDRVLQAFVDEFKCFPKKPQELMSFTKRSPSLNNLKYTEAMKIINYAQLKKKEPTKNGLKSSNATAAAQTQTRSRTDSKYKIIPKSESRSRTGSKYKISPKKKKKKKEAIDPQLVSQSNKENKKNKKKSHKHHHIDYAVGDCVILTQDREGIIRFIGSVSFATDIMYGIELKEGSLGKHDGSLHNKRYFTAPKQRGIFVSKSRIRRKLRKRDRNSSFKLKRSAAVQQLKERRVSANKNNKKKKSSKKWNAPYEIYKTDVIDVRSMRVLYTRASNNLHAHILHKVNQVKMKNDIRCVSKLHSPMIMIHIQPIINSPIITTETVSYKKMAPITHHKKRSSLIMHKRPKTIDVIEAKVAKKAEDIQAAAEVMSPISFSPRTKSTKEDEIQNKPLSQVTINYVEMEQKVNKLMKLLIEREEIITNIDAFYAECEITKNDLKQELFNWVDLLCTNSELFSSTKRIKHVTKSNCWHSLKSEDIQVKMKNNNNNNDDDSKLTEKEKEKLALAEKNDKLQENHIDAYFDSNTRYFYTVFERLLFELNFSDLYFIYDIGFDNRHALSEQHPSQIFLLSGNMSQILNKCSPVLFDDITTFINCILNPHNLSIKYEYLNCANKFNTISMIKYDEQDGIRNDYNFVGRIQYEEMFYNSNDCDNDQMISHDLHYSLITNNNQIIYKSVIPQIFTIFAHLSIKNLKRTICSPSLIFSAAANNDNSAHIECESWNDEGDYYGFIRVLCENELILNSSTTISAKECGYFNKNGAGCGHYKNDTKNKTKYYSGGAYATSAPAPHVSCPAAECYGDDCIEKNVLYFGSPSFDENERGGGIINLLARKTFINYGTICCDGANGMQFGGSSGGSIKIVANNFINYGRITANGGKGAIYQRKGSKRKQVGSNGGDGRIFIICQQFVNKGTIEPKPQIIQCKNAAEFLTNFKFSQIKSISPQLMF